MSPRAFKSDLPTSSVLTPTLCDAPSHSFVVGEEDHTLAKHMLFEKSQSHHHDQGFKLVDHRLLLCSPEGCDKGWSTSSLKKAKAFCTVDGSALHNPTPRLTSTFLASNVVGGLLEKICVPQTTRPIYYTKTPIHDPRSASPLDRTRAAKPHHLGFVLELRHLGFLHLGCGMERMRNLQRKLNTNTASN